MTPESAAASNAAASDKWGCHVFSETDKRRVAASEPSGHQSNAKRVQAYMAKIRKPQTSQQIADAVGLTRIQVNSVLNGLRRYGKAKHTGQRGDKNSPYWGLS